MKIVFKKIPKLAIVFYICGFILTLFGFLHYLNHWQLLSQTQNLQIFIAGAITVVIGSVINLLTQLNKR